VRELAYCVGFREERNVADSPHTYVVEVLWLGFSNPQAPHPYVNVVTDDRHVQKRSVMREPNFRVVEFHSTILGALGALYMTHLKPTSCFFEIIYVNYLNTRVRPAPPWSGRGGCLRPGGVTVPIICSMRVPQLTGEHHDN